jgi:spermidine/putrescine transport system ATP-binding protein
VEEILERVGLPGYGQKKISQISGGQKQRVALARCLVLRPVVLLLDEPLGALDLKLREQMKVELKKLQQQVGTTFVYITHDQSEAMVMSDLVAVMRDGRFEQVDTPQNIYNRPATPFVAQFVGNNNRFLGRLRREGDGRSYVESGDRNRYCIVTPENASSEDRVEMYVRPEAMMINPDERLSTLNRIAVEVKTVLFDAGNSRLIVTPENSDRELIVALPQNRQYDDIRVGDRIGIGWDPASAFCFCVSEIEVGDES